jgi:DNA repair exonuclease SbcCD ATPase subunit
MEVQKIRELLAEAYKNMLNLANEWVNYWWVKNREQGKILHNKLDFAANKFNKALSLLDEPVCKTCGDSKQIINPEYQPPRFLDEGESYNVPGFIPCPDCQQPPASEFTETIREQFTDIDLRQRRLPSRFDMQQTILQLCDRLDAAEAEKIAIIQQDNLSHQYAKEAIRERTQLQEALQTARETINNAESKLATVEAEKKELKKENEFLNRRVVKDRSLLDKVNRYETKLVDLESALAKWKKAVKKAREYDQSGGTLDYALKRILGDEFKEIGK